jgi:hypothetical protein
MSDDNASQMKHRLRADLTLAMKSGRKSEVALVRELIAAIDNAQAAPARVERASLIQHDFRSGSAEVVRRFLSADQIRELLLADIEKRQQAAAEYDRVGNATAAEALRAEAQWVRRYL